MTAASFEVLFEDNQVADAPPAEPARPPRHAAPRRTGSWGSWVLIVAMLAAAGLLFWAPWRTDQEIASPAVPAADPSVAAQPSAVPGAGATGGSAPPAQVVAGPIVPTRIAIPAIGVDTTVEHRGTVRQKNAFTGQLVEGYGIPTSMRTTSWWSDGPRPGSGQMAVILGHTQVGGYGVFNRLPQLRPGQAVDLYDAGGAVLHLSVLSAPLTGLDKSTSALADVLNAHPGGAAVALVTCGGQFDSSVRQSVDNTVVFASVVPAG